MTIVISLIYVGNQLGIASANRPYVKQNCNLKSWGIKVEGGHGSGRTKKK